MEGTNACKCWCLLLFVMKLDHARTQEERLHLTSAELRRNLFASSPLNLPRVFLYALYFVLMPAAILGPVLGVAGTAVLAAVAAYLWLWSAPQALDSFLWFWLAWALVDWGLLLLFRLMMGVRAYRQTRAFLLPEEAAHVDLRPGDKMEFECVDEAGQALVVQMPSRGVYVLVVKVEAGDSRSSVCFDGCACMEEHEVVPGWAHTHAAAYRLEPGCHRLKVQVQGPPAHLKVSLI